MHLTSHPGLAELEDLDLRRTRLCEIIQLNLVGPELRRQIMRTLSEIDYRMTALRQQRMQTNIVRQAA